MKILYFLSSLVLMFGCGSSSGENEQPPDDLERPFSNTAGGWISGQKWDFISGKAVVDIHSAGDYLVIYLWNSDIADPCQEKQGSDLQIHIKALAHEGLSQISKDPFKLDPVILFKAPKFTLENVSADVGFVHIDDITADEVTGRFSGEFSNSLLAKTQASGRFRVPLCAAN